MISGTEGFVSALNVKAAYKWIALIKIVLLTERARDARVPRPINFF